MAGLDQIRVDNLEANDNVQQMETDVDLEEARTDSHSPTTMDSRLDGVNDLDSSSERARHSKSDENGHGLSQEHSNSEGVSDPQTNLIVNYIPLSFTEAKLHSLFAEIGAIESCRLITEKATGKNSPLLEVSSHIWSRKKPRIWVCKVSHKRGRRCCHTHP